MPSILQPILLGLILLHSQTWNVDLQITLTLPGRAKVDAIPHLSRFLSATCRCKVLTSQAASRTAAELEDLQCLSGRGTTVLLDLEWEEAMTPKQLKSLLRQVVFCYGANRRASYPVSLVFSGVQPGSKMHTRLSEQSGYEAWDVKKLAGPYIESFPRERLVYLTTDSQEVLQGFDQDKVYIIGGIVDRNRLKGHTMEKALTQGIATARLPLAEHIQMGSYSRVLTVNHVFDIILDHQANSDWRGACERCVPIRKQS